jgi:hypothetical protein
MRKALRCPVNSIVAAMLAARYCFSIYPEIEIRQLTVGASLVAFVTTIMNESHAGLFRRAVSDCEAT